MPALSLLLLLAAVTAQPAEIQKLTTKTFDKVRNTAEAAMVFYHDTKCDYCAHMDEILAKVSEELSPRFPGLRFAKVDVEDNETVKENEGVQNTPELRLYLNGDIFALYIHAMDAKKIQTWAETILEETREAKFIKTEKDYQGFKAKTTAVYLGLPEVTDRHRTYVNNIARIFPALDVYWAETHSKFDERIVPDEEERFFYHFKFKRSFDDGDKQFTAVEGFRPDAIVRWILKFSKPAVQTLTGELLHHIMNDGLRAVVVFDRTLNTPLMNRFEFAALKSNDTCLFIKSTVDDSNAQILARTLGVQESEFPTMRALQTREGRIRKFKFEGEFTQRRIFNFLYDFEHNDLKEYHKCGKYVNNFGKDFHKYNRNQFLKVVESDKKDMFVAFVGEWCPDCGSVQTVLVDLHKKMKLNRDAVILAEVNVDENDIDSVLTRQLPSIQLYKRGKMDRPVLYKEKFSVEEVLKYLEKELATKFTREDDEPDDEYEEEIPEPSGEDDINGGEDL